MYRALKQNVYC